MTMPDGDFIPYCDYRLWIVHEILLVDAEFLFPVS